MAQTLMTAGGFGIAVHKITEHKDNPATDNANDVDSKKTNSEIDGHVSDSSSDSDESRLSFDEEESKQGYSSSKSLQELLNEEEDDDDPEKQYNPCQRCLRKYFNTVHTPILSSFAYHLLRM